MGTRKHYTDEERAEACALLKANGYPEKKGALTATSNVTGVPISTLRGWFNELNNAPPAKLRKEKLFDLQKIIANELLATIEAMDGKRDTATYSNLSWTLAVLTDKLVALTGGVNHRVAIEDWRTEAIRMITDREIDFKATVETFGKHDAELLFRQANVPIPISETTES